MQSSPHRRWSTQFRENQKSVTLHFNGSFGKGVKLDVQPSWKFHDFVVAASARLDMKDTAKIVFSSDGVAINDCMMIQDNDIIFLSNGASFVNLSAAKEGVEGSIHAAGVISTGTIPSNVGGYIVGSLLGKGAFGEVFQGKHQLTGELAALKFLRKSDILRDLSALQLVSKEIHCLKALRHNNIIRLIHHLDSQHHVILVFELMEGGDLLHYMLQQEKKDPNESEEDRVSLSEENARLVFQQMLNGVSYAHNQRVCHRDLKLENLLLKEASLDCVKIADFGLSDFYRPGSVVKSDVGTLAFLAPEVFRGSANAGPPLDVWSMGVILFTMLCGRLPFDSAASSGRRSSSRSGDNHAQKEKILRAQYKVSEKVSPDAKDLLRRIFKVDPLERITVLEMMSHTWLRPTSSLHHHFIDLHTSCSRWSTRSDSPLQSPVAKSAAAHNSNIDILSMIPPLAEPAKTIDGVVSTDTLASTSTFILQTTSSDDLAGSSTSSLPILSNGSPPKARRSSPPSFNVIVAPRIEIISEMKTEEEGVAVAARSGDGIEQSLALSLPPVKIGSEESKKAAHSNGKILQKLSIPPSPSLDLPPLIDHIVPQKSFSTKEASPKKDQLRPRKAVLTRLNRNKSATKLTKVVADAITQIGISSEFWLNKAAMQPASGSSDASVIGSVAGSGDELELVNNPNRRPSGALPRRQLSRDLKI